MKDQMGVNEITPDENAVSSDLSSRWLNLASSPVCGTFSGHVLAYSEEEYSY